MAESPSNEALHVLIEQYMQRQDEINDNLLKVVTRQDEFLHGTFDKPGLVTRMDRLEQSDKTRRTLSIAAITMVISLALKDMWDVLTMWKH